MHLYCIVARPARPMVISLSVSSAPYKDDIHSVILLSLLVPHIEEMDLGSMSEFPGGSIKVQY